MKQLKNCVKLRSQVKIYVPSTYSVDNEIDNSEYVDRTLTFLSKCFQGATCSEALGAWVTASGNLIKEKVSMCFSFANQEDLNKNIDSIYDYCLNLKLELKQEMIALELNGELYFI